jgi:hypothetical protein
MQKGKRCFLKYYFAAKSKKFLSIPLSSNINPNPCYQILDAATSE